MEAVTIEVKTQLQDGMSAGLKSSAASADRFCQSIEKTKQQCSASNTALDKLKSTAFSLASKAIRIPVSIIDKVTSPLKKIYNFATSIKGVLTGMIAGQAMSKLISAPIQLADNYTSAFTGFKTLFQSADKAQALMDQLDEFARTTPFKTAGVISQAQKMVALGWNTKDIIGDLKTIGDAAAATGKGDEGLERIVLALSQIKSKGKLSTEELNQLAEAGISAKRYLAEGLGYGSGDAGMAKLSKALAKGAIGSEKAIEAIMNGMKEYAGMMDETAKATVEGLKSNIEDTFEINISRKWGQGLQEGAVQGLSAIADLLDASQDSLSAFGDTLKGIASEVSTTIAGIVQGMAQSLIDLTDDSAFKNANAFEKIEIIWDKVISEPLSEWWNGDGGAKVKAVATDMGNKLGEFLADALSAAIGKLLPALLGNLGKFLPGGEAPDLASWGTALLLGKGIASSGIGNIIGGAGKAVSWLSQLSGGKEAASVASAVSKAAQAVVPGTGTQSYYGEEVAAKAASLNDIASTLWGKWQKQQSLANSKSAKLGDYTKVAEEWAAKANAATTDEEFQTAFENWSKAQNQIDSVPKASEKASELMAKAQNASSEANMFNRELADTAATGATGATGKTAAASAAAGKLAIASGVGWALGAVGIVAGINDLVDSTDEIDKKAKQDKAVTGITKIGMVGAGAATGALIGSVIPVVGTAVGAGIGAGIGGIAALAGGNSIGKAISDRMDGTAKIKDDLDSLNKSLKDYQELSDKSAKIDTLIDRWKELKMQISGGKLDTDGVTAAASEIKDIESQLAQMYPDMITNLDTVNGLYEARLQTIQNISKAEQDAARSSLVLDIQTAEQDRPQIEANMAEQQGIMDNIDQFTNKYFGQGDEDSMNSLVGQLASARQDYLNNGGSSSNTGEYLKENYAGLLSNLRQKETEINNALEQLGIGGGQSIFSSDNMATILGELDNWNEGNDTVYDTYTSGLNDKRKEAADRYDESYAQDKAIYDSRKALLESDYGSPDTLLANWWSGNQKDKDALNQYLEQLNSLSGEFQYLKDEDKGVMTPEQLAQALYDAGGESAQRELGNVGYKTTAELEKEEIPVGSDPVMRGLYDSLVQNKRANLLDTFSQYSGADFSKLSKDEIAEFQKKMLGLGIDGLTLGNYGADKDGADGVYGTMTKKAWEMVQQMVQEYFPEEYETGGKTDEIGNTDDSSTGATETPEEPKSIFDGFIGGLTDTTDALVTSKQKLDEEYGTKGGKPEEDTPDGHMPTKEKLELTQQLEEDKNAGGYSQPFEYYNAFLKDGPVTNTGAFSKKETLRLMEEDKQAGSRTIGQVTSQPVEAPQPVIPEGMTFEVPETSLATLLGSLGETLTGLFNFPSLTDGTLNANIGAANGAIEAAPATIGEAQSQIEAEFGSLHDTTATASGSMNNAGSAANGLCGDLNGLGDSATGAAAATGGLAGGLTSAGQAASDFADRVNSTKIWISPQNGRTLPSDNKMETHATGGLFSAPHMGLVAEDGPEAIIPLSGKRRNRGLELWQRAGEMLGVQPYADGGIVGAAAMAASGAGVSVNVGGVTIQISGSGDAAADIEGSEDEIASAVADAIARGLSQVFGNMPVAVS